MTAASPNCRKFHGFYSRSVGTKGSSTLVPLAGLGFVRRGGETTQAPDFTGRLSGRVTWGIKAEGFPATRLGDTSMDWSVVFSCARFYSLFIVCLFVLHPQRTTVESSWYFEHLHNNWYTKSSLHSTSISCCWLTQCLREVHNFIVSYQKCLASPGENIDY